MKSIQQLLVLTKRILKQNLTNADTIITVIGTPVFMLLLFVYVFGGNISIDGSAGNSNAYLNYSLPGFLLISMAMGSAYTALRINNDKMKGFLDRLHTLPIKRWVILGSHVLASVVFMLLAEVIIFIIGVLLGYRPDITFINLIYFILLSIIFAFSITLLAIPFSLKASSYEGAGGFSYILLMLLFISSAFMPMAGMAKPIRLFAEYQPMTSIVEVSRDLLNNTFVFTSSSSIQAILWLCFIAILFGFLSYRRYQIVFTKV